MSREINRNIQKRESTERHKNIDAIPDRDRYNVRNREPGNDREHRNVRHNERAIFWLNDLYERGSV